MGSVLAYFYVSDDNQDSNTQIMESHQAIIVQNGHEKYVTRRIWACRAIS
jgi:hypothetical protein